jgi:hypothetical protein
LKLCGMFTGMFAIGRLLVDHPEQRFVEEQW